MRRKTVLRVSVFLVTTLTASLVGAGAAAGAGGPAIPGVTFDPAGVTGPPDQPSAGLRYVALFGGARGTTVAAINTENGIVRQSRWIRGSWALPAVTLRGDAGGLAADGGTLVLVRQTYSLRPRRTTFLIVDTLRSARPGRPGARRANAGFPVLRIADRVVLDGAYSFDAISPDGRLMYLVQYPDPRDPLDYSVRAYDLVAGELRPGRIVDPAAPDEQMTGQPVARATSPDGRWAYTLYGGGEETFIHALDTQEATAVCIDLPQLERGNIFRFGLEVNPATGAITALKRGDPVAQVDPQTFEVSSPPSGDTVVSDDDVGGIPWALLAALAGGLTLGGAMIARRRRRRSVVAELPPDPLADESHDEVSKAPVAPGAGEQG